MGVPARRARRDLRRRLFLEPLEDRTLLSSSIFGHVWNDVIANGVRGAAEPGLAAVTLFLDANANGIFDSSTQTFSDNAPTVVPGPLGATSFVADLVLAGLPERIGDLNISIDVSKSTPGEVLVGLLTPLGRTVGTGATLFFLHQGDQFNGTFDDQAAQPIVGAGSPFAGSFRPQEALTVPHAHVYDGDPNGTWSLIFFGEIAGITLNSWSLEFTIPETSTQTGSDGNYAFTDLSTGTHQVRAVVPPAGQHTFPAAGYAVSLGDNDIVSGFDFGIKPGPDLAGGSLVIATPTPDWGQTITVNYTLGNLGAADAGAFAVELLLAADGSLGGNDLLLRTLSFDGLPGLTTIGGSVQVTLPRSPGQPPLGFAAVRPENLLLGLVIDANNQIVESNEGNNSNQGAGADTAFLMPQPNQAITTDAAVQQFPSLAVDPLDPDHLVTAYMDYSLLTTGYAGLAVAVSRDGGDTWSKTSIPLPASFSQGAANPTVRFDAQGKVYVSFMAATFPGAPSNINLRGAPTSAPELLLGQKPSLTYPFDPLGGTAASDERYLGLLANNSILVARSSDGGDTWNAQDVSAVTANLWSGAGFVFYDTSPELAVDTFATLPNGQPNPNFGNLYVVWTRYYPPGQFPGQPAGTGGGEIYLAVSDDGGQTWQTRLRADGNTVLRDPTLLTANLTGGTSVSIDPRIAIGPEGDLYVTHFAGGAFAVYHSTDAAASFVLPDRSILNLGLPFGSATTARPPRTLDNYNFRLFPVRQIVADPVRPGHVYALEMIRVVNQFSGVQIDAAELNFAFSDDYGRTWTRVFTVGGLPSNIDEIAPALRGDFRSTLNDDDLGRFLRFDQSLGDEVITGQALPKLTIDADGNLALTWYDTRRNGSQHLLDVFSTVSTDGGRTWRANARISDVSFDAHAGVFVDAAGKQNYYLGDLIGVAAAGNVVYAAWTDTRLGNQDIFFARYPLAPAPAPSQDRFEDNQTPATATDLGRIDLPRVLPRLTVDALDEDWFRLKTAASGSLIVSASGASGEPLHLELWDHSGATLLATGGDLLNDAGELIGRQLSFATAADQTFLVRVTGTSISGLDYALTAQSLTADLGTRVQGAVAGAVTAGGRAVYLLTPGLAGSMELALTGAGNVQGVLDLEVYAADGVSLLASGFVQAGKVERLTLPVEQGKALLLQVSGKPRALLPLGAGSFTLDFINFDQFVFPDDAKLVHRLEAGTLSGSTPLVIPFTAQATGTLQAMAIVLAPVRRTLLLEILGADGATVLASGAGGTAVSVAVEQGQRVHFRVSGTPTNLTQNFTLDFANLFDVSVSGKAALFFGASGLPSGVSIADLNGDAIPDLVASSDRFSDAINVLLGNGDGTFRAPRQFEVGAGLGAGGTRDLAVADFNRDTIPDIVVANPLSADVSLLLGRGDGTFLPQRRFDAAYKGSSLSVGDFNSDGVPDLAVAQNSLLFHDIAILLARGDGTFLPPQRFAGAFDQQFAVRVGDFNADHNDDLALFSRNGGNAQILLGHGDGTFADAGIVACGSTAGSVLVADVDGDGRDDILTGDLNTPTVFLVLGNGDGTFQTMRSFSVGADANDAVRRGVFSLAVGDFGRQQTLADGSLQLGPPDGKTDLVVNLGVRAGSGNAQIVFVPRLAHSQGAFVGFGAGRVWAEGRLARTLAAADVNGDGKLDVAAADFGGVRVIYGSPPLLPAGSSFATARDLGVVLHVAQPTQAIVKGHEGAYFKLTVPSETVAAAGAQVLDFSALFQYVEGAGLQMEVRDAAGALLGSGERFRIQAPQGAELTVHVFGVADAGGQRGAGAFTLNIDVLPQVVGMQALEVLPGAPVTCLVLTLQGDRLDPASAENPANYQVIWLGPDGVAGTADDQVMPLVSGSPAVNYNPAANTDVSSGRTYLTSARSTISLLFAQPLPAGSYRVVLSPGIQAAALNDEEIGKLAGKGLFPGHALASLVGGQVVEGAQLDVANLVPPLGSLGNLDAIAAGTAFLTQLQNDLGAHLDALLRTLGDDQSITSILNQWIQGWVAPGNGTEGQPLTNLLVIWLDPVSIDLADAQGTRTVYSLQTNTVVSALPKTFVEVGGNVELIVMASVSGRFSLSVDDVSPTARGGAVMLTDRGVELTGFTDALRAGQRQFQLDVPGSETASPTSSPPSGAVFPAGELPFGGVGLFSLASPAPLDAASGLTLTALANFAAPAVLVTLATVDTEAQALEKPDAAPMTAVFRQFLMTSLGETWGEALYSATISLGDYARALMRRTQGWLQRMLLPRPGADNPQGVRLEGAAWEQACLVAWAGGQLVGLSVPAMVGGPALQACVLMCGQAVATGQLGAASGGLTPAAGARESQQADDCKQLESHLPGDGRDQAIQAFNENPLNLNPLNLTPVNLTPEAARDPDALLIAAIFAAGLFYSWCDERLARALCCRVAPVLGRNAN